MSALPEDGGLERCREGQACWQPPGHLKPTLMKVEHHKEEEIVFPALGKCIFTGEAVHICT